jgi:hypothetical protein
MEVSGQFHAPAALTPEKGPRYPLDRRLGGHQSRSECGDEEKKNAGPVLQPLKFVSRIRSSGLFQFRISFWNYESI